MPQKVIPHSLFTEYDVFLFKSGSHYKLYEKFGSRQIDVDGQQGTYFSVFAPAARTVEVIGNFNQWNGQEYQLYVRWDNSGIWEGFIPDVGHGELYKYRIHSNYDTKVRDKADPYGLYFEMAPKTSSITWDTQKKWSDEVWMKDRVAFDPYTSPISIYEVHLGSWMKKEVTNHSLNYEELASELVTYVKEMGYTHVELLPITEHPYFPSWGYLSTGFYAPTSRYGSPQEFMSLVGAFHNAGVGVILDWVPAHFPSDDGWLADFDGSHVYEHPNPKKGYHPDWNSLIFNFERPEIKSFLISSAHFWLDRYHLDGLRVDAVASMIYLDYSRDEGGWDPNEFGNNENLAAIAFLKDLNHSCYTTFPGIMMMAEESTAFGGVTRPVHENGLGFGFKWMMGWMNDTLRFIERDPIYRRFHHDEITFSMTYAYSESYILPLSHDEVVHGKKSLIQKMPGDEWQKFANLRLLYAYMYSHPGHKLLFMGDDIGQTTEWDLDRGVEWQLLDYPYHKGVKDLVKDLNKLYSAEAAFHKYSFEAKGFQWIEYNDRENSVLSYIRHSDDDLIVILCNFTPLAHDAYKIGLPIKGSYKEIFNSNYEKYGGTGTHTNKTKRSKKKESHGFEHSIEVAVPALGVLYLKSKKK